MKHETSSPGSRGFLAIAATAVVAIALAACGGNDGVVAPAVPTVAAPGAVTSLTATGGENVATLTWAPPAASTTAGTPDSYEIYRSTTATTAATIVAPTNFVTTMPAVAAQTAYSFTDVGLPGQNTTYNYVVTATNAGGETPSVVVSASVTGPPTPATFGNNFSAALIFADDIGISNLPITVVWTLDTTLIDYNTGLRPTAAEVTALPVGLVLPSLTVTSSIDPLYYEQKTVNTWQGEWAKGATTRQDVTAKWGDNLTGTASLSSNAKIRIEMVLSKDVSGTPMTSYPMALLSGSGVTELQGTDGVAFANNTAFVFATNARLQIRRLDAGGVPIEPPVFNQALFDPVSPGGLNKLSGEIPVSGNFTYGFVWHPAALGATAGNYRLTFKLDPTSAFGTGNPANNTFIQAVANGVRVSETEVYIDINVK